VKRGNLRGGHVKDARCSGPPRKVTAFKRRRVQEVIDQNPRLSLREITNVANVGLCSISIQTIVAESDFRLKVPRKKPFGGWDRKKNVRTLHRDVVGGIHSSGLGLFSSMSPLLSTIHFLQGKSVACVEVRSCLRRI
jgi:hypothetical protein